jgi:cytochrome c oxidase subunit 3
MATALILPRPSPASGAARPAIPSHRLAMLIFLTAETMLFTGLLGGYLVLRYSVPMWPPAGQPLLPLWAGGANLILLTAASLGIHQALRSARRAGGPRVARGILVSLAAGAAFLAVLGVEWSRLHAEGLSLSTGGTYGALFYTLTGCHALHVIAVWIWSAALLPPALRDRYYPARHHPVEMAGMFWHFVTLAWLILFVILYLT